MVMGAKITIRLTSISFRETWYFNMLSLFDQNKKKNMLASKKRLKIFAP